MNRSTFFKSAIAGIAIFFGFKSANKPYEPEIITKEYRYDFNGNIISVRNVI